MWHTYNQNYWYMKKITLFLQMVVFVSVNESPRVESTWLLLCLEQKTSPIGSYVWLLGPYLVRSFRTAMEPLAALVEKVHHRRQVLRLDALSPLPVLSLLPVHRWNVSGQLPDGPPCLTFLLPYLPHHDGWQPLGTCEQEQILPLVAFIGYFTTAAEWRLIQLPRWQRIIFLYQTFPVCF